MTNEEIRQLYSENEDFKRYVDEYRRGKGISLEVTLTIKIVKIVAQYYADRAKS